MRKSSRSAASEIYEYFPKCTEFLPCDWLVRYSVYKGNYRFALSLSHQRLYKALELLHVVSIRNSCWNISESKISFSQEVKSVTFLWGCLLSANFTSLSKCLEERNMARISAGHLVLCCGRCWQERCRTRMWTPPLSSGEWATTVCSCPCPTAVQRASNCCWGNAGEQTWRETKLEGRKKIKSLRGKML